MASLLESAIKKAVYNGFKGKLLKGVLRRETVASLNALGDSQSSTVSTFPFEGIRESFNAAFAAAAGIPVTDVKILIIAGSISTRPEQDDKIQIRGEWYQVRTLVDIDPADATYQLAAYKCDAP